MKSAWLISAFLFLTLSSLGATAAPDAVQYQLSERCGKTAHEWFKDEWGDGIATKDGTQMMATYSNHYNRKLNACMLLLTMTTMQGKTELVSYILFDVNEQKDYGECDELTNHDCAASCHVTSNICKSYDEWRGLVEPFMTE